jgi:hypothetical protein
MPKTKISEYSATANSNTDVGGINIDEGCAPSGINDAIRTMMAQLKNFQTGTGGDAFNGPVNGTLGATTAATAAVTTLTTSSTVTHNGGTANGVAYLNGSKVLTTGSALVFDGANLGLGVTPSAWATYKALQVNTTGCFSNVSGTTRIGDNFYYDGSNYRYLTNSFVSMEQYNGGAGGFAWFTAPSGTAGNAITFTQAMTLDASGNLGIGTTSPATKLDVNGDVTQRNGSGIIIGTITNNGGWYDFGGSNNVNGAQMSHAGTVRFLTASTERARIDSSGNLLVGATASSFKILSNVQSGADRNVFSAQIEGASNGFQIKWNHATSTTRVNISNLPTSASGLASGDLYVLAGALMVA